MSTNIPGLNFCGEDSGTGIEIDCFEGTSIIPESHMHGNCHTVYEFERMETISEGWFGTIYKCKEKKSNELYTLKRYRFNTEEDIPSYILRERNLLSTLLHDNVIKCYRIVVKRDLFSNYILLDYCPVSLNDLIEKKPQLKFIIHESSVVKYIMKQLFRGLEFIHNAVVIHRDINDCNILFTESGVLKITGFHAARFHSKGDMTPGFGGMFSFRAPELLLNSKRYGPAVDMWSAACVFAKLLLKKNLFRGSSALAVLHSISLDLGIPSDDKWPGFSDLFSNLKDKAVFGKDVKYHDLNNLFAKETSACKNLMKGLLIYYPNARLSAKDCLESSYFTQAPVACAPDKFVSILKSVLPPGTQGI